MNIHESVLIYMYASHAHGDSTVGLRYRLTNVHTFPGIVPVTSPLGPVDVL